MANTLSLQMAVAGEATPAEASARILLVDDEQSIQTLLTYPLRKEGYEVVAARDGLRRPVPHAVLRGEVGGPGTVHGSTATRPARGW